MGVKTPGFYEPTSPPVVSDKIIVVGGAVIDNYSTRGAVGRHPRLRHPYRQAGLGLGSGRRGRERAALGDASPTPTIRPIPGSPASYDAEARPGLSADGRADARYLGRQPQRRSPSAIRARWSRSTSTPASASGPTRPCITICGTWTCRRSRRWSICRRANGIVPAVVQPAKTGNLFVLDRRNGQPIVPAPERPVPQGAAPGDHVAPTQPFSELTFRPEEKLTGADMWGATIFDQLACRIMFHQHALRGHVHAALAAGHARLSRAISACSNGAASRSIRSGRSPSPTRSPCRSSRKLIPRGPDNPAAPNDAHPSGSEIGVQPMYGAPYGVVLHPFLSPIGLPCMRPPWGYMAGDRSEDE